MDLLRVWRRRTYGAVAGAIIAPLAIIGAAAVVGIGGGGIAGLGSLSQALSGPELPEVTPLSTRRRQDRGTDRLLAQVRRAAAPQATSAAPAAPTGGTQTAVADAPAEVAPPPATGDAELPGDTFDPGGATTPSRDPDVPQAAEPPPAIVQAVEPEPAGPVRQLGDTVTSITDGVPLVGGPVGQVVDGVADTVDGLLPTRP